MTDPQTTPPPEDASTADANDQSDPAESDRKATLPWFKNKLIIVPLAAVVLIVIILAATGRFDRGTSDTAKSGVQPTVTSTPQALAATAGIGTKVRDGKFEFVVTGVEHLGKTFEGKVGKKLTAQGEFVMVRVNVTNIGSEAQAPLDCQCQVLFNDKGQKLETSPAILSTKEALKFVQIISPGDTVEGAPVLFDVPPGTKLDNIELHGFPTSQGVKVKLS